MLEPSAITPPPPPNAPDGRASTLLTEVRRAQTRALWKVGGLCGAATLVSLVLGAALVANVAPGAGSLVLLLAPVGALAVTAAFGVLVARRRVGDAERTARQLARSVPELHFDLLAAVELSRALGERHDFSPELARAFLRDVDARAARLSVPALIDHRPVRRATWLFAGVAAAAGALVGWQSARVRNGLNLALSSPRTDGTGLIREPITGDFELTYRYPVHTGLQPRTVVGTSGELSGPAGTEVAVRTRADRAVDEAALSINGRRLPLVVHDRELSGSLVLETSGHYHVVFLDGARVVAEGPDLPVQVEADQPPQVQLTAPIDRLELEPDRQQATLKYDATDDYGLSSLELVYRPAGGEAKRVSLKSDDGRTSRGEYRWDLTGLKLKPGQSVSYYLEAKDNDAVSGPKAGTSRSQTVSLYSAAEHRREALKRAEALWERLVTHTADRLEGADRTPPLTEAAVTAGKPVDQRASLLAADLGTFAADLDRERDPPEDLRAALRNIGIELSRDTVQVSTQRRLFERFGASLGPGAATERGTRLVATLTADAEHSENNVLYLEALLDRHKLTALQELAAELREDRRQLSSLLEEFQRTNDQATKDALLEHMQQLRQRMLELQQRMAELAKGIRDEHLNREALAELMEERDLASKLDEVERMVREGRADEAMKKMQELAMELDQFLENLEQAGEEAELNADPELAERYQRFQKDLEDTIRSQETTADATQTLRDKYRQRAKERIANQGATLKRELLGKLEELTKDYQSLNADRFGYGFEEPRLQALQNAEHARQSLEADDFDLASDAAERLLERASQLGALAEDQRRRDEMFQNPTEVKRQSRQLEDRLKRDAKRAEEIAGRLRSLFPQGSQMSPEDQRRLSELQQTQRQLGHNAEQLERDMDELARRAPIFDDDARQQLQQAGQRMDAAQERLRARDPARGYGEQQGALQALRGLHRDMQQQGKGRGKGLPLPMRGRSSGRRAADEKVAIPDEDPNQAPRDFRKDVMDAMKQGAPDRYRDQNKRYYEELVK